VISRAAESCFWQNRYLERAETLVRLLETNLAFQLDVTLPDAERWRPLVVVTGELARFEEHVGAEAAEDEEAVQHFLTWEEENPSSLVSSLSGARENARTIRETVSREMWETLNELWLFVQGQEARRLYQRDRYAFYQEVRDRCLLFHAQALTTMLHEEPFDFMRLGTTLERAGQTARLLDVKYHSMGPTHAELEMPAEAAQWLAVLRFCAGSEPFFKRSGFVLSGPNVAAFLLFDRSFPRSVHHNLSRVDHPPRRPARLARAPHHRGRPRAQHPRRARVPRRVRRRDRQRRPQGLLRARPRAGGGAEPGAEAGLRALTSRCASTPSGAATLRDG
jgi:uncharacterized alpha-E superfamily protein